MRYTTLGSTGLAVSVAGLGCGGNSRIGQGAGLSEAQSVALVRAAMDLGVTYFDTAEAYGTEAILGLAIAPGARDRVVISTKSRIVRGSQPMSPTDVVASLEASLRRLRTDYVDVFLLHGVSPALYDHALAKLAPALLAEKAKGKIRHLGLSETSPNDPYQTMLQRALVDSAAAAEPLWEVFMLAFHMLNQGARLDLFPRTRQQGVGTLLMFVVRNIFSRPGLLQAAIAELAAAGKVPAELAGADDPLGFLVHPGGAESLLDAAYRFARHEPGCHVVLTGTGSVDHLAQNVTSINRGPLPAASLARLDQLFGHVDSISGD